MTVEKRDITQIDTRRVFWEVVKNRWMYALSVILTVGFWIMNFILSTITLLDLVIEICSTVLLIFFFFQIVSIDTTKEILQYDLSLKVERLEKMIQKEREQEQEEKRNEHTRNRRTE